MIPSQPPEPCLDTECPNCKDTQPTNHTPNWCEKATLLLEALGILGLAVYCIYTVLEFKTFDSERQLMEAEQKENRLARELDERAWVTAYKFEKNNGEYRVLCRNTGRTPALNVDSDVRSTQVFNDAETATWMENPPGPYAGVLGPNMEWQTHSEGIKGKYLYGRIWYDDIFGKHHWTDFCAQCLEENIASSDKFYIMPTGNSTDDSSTNNPKKDAVIHGTHTRYTTHP